MESGRMKDDLFDESRPLEIADQGCFYAGGRYVETDGGRSMLGQMFVQYQVPAKRRHPHPIVMIHGGGQTAVNFLGTPDGRRGWADYFLASGYAVYLVDQPGRARSGYFEGYGETVHRDADTIAGRFTAPETRRLYPQAELHTQWPGGGSAGDPAFDQFYASQVQNMTDIAALEAMMREAGAALLDRIGPAILLTHSQAGPFGWTIADARPRLTRGPLTFSPAVKDASELKFVRQDKADGPGLVRCWLQAGTPRKLTNLAGIPILIVTAEASYHAPYDHCTSHFLRQAGVEHDFVRLADAGIRGNGHMMMLEKNNLEIARYLREWVERNIK